MTGGTTKTRSHQAPWWLHHRGHRGLRDFLKLLAVSRWFQGASCRSETSEAGRGNLEFWQWLHLEAIFRTYKREGLLAPTLPLYLKFAPTTQEAPHPIPPPTPWGEGEREGATSFPTTPSPHASGGRAGGGLRLRSARWFSLVAEATHTK